MDYSTQGNKKRRKKTMQRAKKGRNKIGVIIFRVVLSVGIIACFALAGLVFGAYMGIIENAPDLNDYKAVQPVNFASIVYDKYGNEIDRFTGEENREYVSLKNIPENLKNAVIAIEDERYYSHNGVDLKSMVRAVYSTLTGDRQGASTITQQLIKNNITKKLVNDVESKLQEQYLAVKFEETLVEQLGSREEAKSYILETYLNSIALNHGLYGVQAAAHYYFAGKDVSELTLSECAVIASITNRPTTYTPVTHPDYNSKRSSLVLGKMLELDFITQSEYDSAMKDINLDNKENVYSRVTQYKPTSGTDSGMHDYYSDALIEQLAEDLISKLGLTRQQAMNMIYNGGLKITVPKNDEIQDIMNEVFLDESFFPQYDFEIDVTYILSVQNTITGETHNYEENKVVKTEEEMESYITSIKDKYLTANTKLLADRVVANPQPQAAMVIIDQHTGHVMGIVGGRGEKNTNRGFNRATQSARHPGSVFKVLASYAPAIDLGRIGAGSILYDEAIKYEQYGNYEPKNWTGSFAGPVTARQGVYNSMNVVTVKNMVDTGVENCFEYLKQFGFTTLVDGEWKNDRYFSDLGPSTALGGLTYGVTQLEVTAAYGTIANGGVYQRPMFYTKVLDHNNNIILESVPEADSRVVLKSTTAYILTDMMKDVLVRGTGGRAAFQNVKMAVAGKTGTSTSTNDLTFVGYTPYYVAGVWLGHDKEKFLTNDASQHMIIWRTIMERVHENLEYKDFEKPNGIVNGSLCMDSGLLAISELCANDSRGNRVRSDIFAAGTLPTEYCDRHASITIDSATGLLATSETPPERRRTIIGVITPNSEISNNDHEIPESMAEGDTSTRLNENYEGAIAPTEDGRYEIDPITGEVIFIPRGSDTNPIMPGDNTGGSYVPAFPTFPSGGFSDMPSFYGPNPNDNVPQASPSPLPAMPESLPSIFAPPATAPAPYYPDVAPYNPNQGSPGGDNAYIPLIPSEETPATERPPVVD